MSSKDPELQKMISEVSNAYSTSEIKKFYDTAVTASMMDKYNKPREEQVLKSRCVVCAKHLVLYTNPWQSKDSITGRQIRCEECGLVYFKEPPLKDEEYD